MYSYAAQREWLSSDEGQRAFIAFRDTALGHLRVTGAFTLGRAIGWVRDDVGDSFKMIACVDRLAELGDVVLVRRDGRPSQDQVYVRP